MITSTGIDALPITGKFQESSSSMSSSAHGGLSIRRPIQAIYSLLTDPKCFWILASLSVAGDGVLTELIIRFIPCQQLFS